MELKNLSIPQLIELTVRDGLYQYRHGHAGVTDDDYAVLDELDRRALAENMSVSEFARAYCSKPQQRQITYHRRGR